MAKKEEKYISYSYIKPGFFWARYEVVTGKPQGPSVGPWKLVEVFGSVPFLRVRQYNVDNGTIACDPEIEHTGAKWELRFYRRIDNPPEEGA